MPDKKESAGSAKIDVAKNHNFSCGDRNDPANNVIAEFIEYIKVALEAVVSAGAPHAPSTDILRPCPVVPIERCHASISYISRHGAISINLYWGGAWPVSRPNADDAGERWTGAVMSEFAGSAM